MSFDELVRATGDQPVTVAGLVDDLARLGVRPGVTLLVHASMRSLGWVCGGAHAAVLALEEVLGVDGTLVMPAHSGDLSDPVHWRNPPVPEAWWETIRQSMPPFDPDLTPSWGIGAIAECFRKQPGVARSQHPQVSFVARGPHAATITANHPLTPALGEGSPLAHLYDLDARVLLIGIGYASNTSLHLAEYRANYPNKPVHRTGAPLMRAGRREWVAFEDLDWDDADFEKIGAQFGQATGQVSEGPLGRATALLMPQRQLVDFGTRWFEEHRA